MTLAALKAVKFGVKLHPPFERCEYNNECIFSEIMKSFSTNLD